MQRVWRRVREKRATTRRKLHLEREIRKLHEPHAPVAYRLAFEETAVLVRRMRPSSSAFSVRERSETPVRS
jgi:hypothetical protein